MFKFILPALLLLSSYCFAQDGRAVLLNQLVHKQPDTARLKTLQKLGNYYYKQYRNNADLDTASYYLEKALIISRAVHDGHGTASLNCAAGDIYLARNDTSKGEKRYELAAKYYGDGHDSYNQSVIWRNLAEAICKIRANKSPVKISELTTLAEKYYTMAKDILKVEKDTGKCISALHSIAASYGVEGLPRQAKGLCRDLIAKYTNSRFNNLTRVYLFLSEKYRNDGNGDSSLFFMLKCIKRIEKNKDTANAHRACGELALVYQQLGQTENSILWFKKTLQLREKIPGLAQEYLYRTAGFIAQELIKQGKPGDALQVIIGLEKRKPPIDDKGRALIAQVKAYCYNGLKQYKLAGMYYQKMIRFFRREDPESYFALIANYDIGEFYVQQKKYDSAAVYLKGLDTIYFDILKRRDIQFLFFKVDSAKDRTLSALQHFQKFKLLNDSVFNTAKSKQISELQIKYATDQKENDIESLKKDSLLQFEKVKQANNARNLTFIGTGLLLVVIGLLYSSYRANQKKTREINLKNTSLGQLLGEKDSLLEEKEWLMKEIHHRVKNNLQIVMGLLQRQSAFVNNKEAFTAIRNSEHRMHSIALIHQKLYQSESFTMVNMADYIDEMTTYLRESFDLGTRIGFEKDVERINFEVSMAVPLGLILNEAITNAIKYAFPTHEKGCIRVSLNQIADNSYILKIADDGRGLPDDFDIKKANSMGFNLMRGLSKQVGGSLEVSGDKGVCISINFETGNGDKTT